MGYLFDQSEAIPPITIKVEEAGIRDRREKDGWLLFGGVTINYSEFLKEVHYNMKDGVLNKVAFHNTTILNGPDTPELADPLRKESGSWFLFNIKLGPNIRIDGECKFASSNRTTIASPDNT